jgi:hypothetical protein
MPIFWDIMAIENGVALGVDAINAFTQSPPPYTSTYVCIVIQMEEWLKEQM